MATMIDIKPTYSGEGKVWESLRSFLPNDIVVYNNREVNGREYDFCLLLENMGLIIIEVKGWLFDKIKVHGVDNIEVEGYSEPQGSPKKQARVYRFAILNKIVEKYNQSPLVSDMVCYPFISENEYYASKLNIVSEPEFTIFKEDIEDKNKLIEKIKKAYDATKRIPHADFTYDLMLKIRQYYEPDFCTRVSEIDVKSKPYSILSIIPGVISEDKIHEIVKEYVAGIKRIVFVSNRNSYFMLLDEINEKFKEKNIRNNKGNLEIGFEKIIHNGTDYTRIFNFEIYYLEKLEEIVNYEINVEEGHSTETEHSILTSLSDVSGFNFQQYQVEHASTMNNTLIEAGAGTGKTYSMVSRIAFLCNKKVNSVSNIADEIAMVTFTNDAASNMKKRLKQMFVNYFILTSNPIYLKFIEDTDRAHISTIHNFSFDILRQESLYTGLGTNFRIATDEYRRSKTYDQYLSIFLEEMENENPNFINELPVSIYDLKKRIMYIADKLLSKSIDLSSIKASEMGVPIENLLPYFNAIIERVMIPAEKEYTTSSFEKNDIDLRECIILLEKVLNKLPNKLDQLKYRFMFIDEFQDTDDVQIHAFQILQKLINEECRLFVVGDLKQSIYRFRGAKLSAFSLIKSKTLYEWDTFRLTRNYRTDSRLLEVYDKIFEHMGSTDYLPYHSTYDKLSSDIRKECSDKDIFVPVYCHANDPEKFYNALFEIITKQKLSIEETIQKLKESNGHSLSSEERTIAILVRSNWQIENIVAEAKKRHVMIDVKSGGDLFQLESTIDLYKLLLALGNCANPLCLINFIESNFTPLSIDYQSYHNSNKDDCLEDLIRILDHFFMERMKKTWSQIVNEAYTQPVLFVIKQITDALQPWKIFSSESYKQKHYIANYEYLLERIIRNSRVDTLTLNQVIQYLKINITTKQKQLSRDVEIEYDGVRILCTTVHKSKGLEYGTVILPFTHEDIGSIKQNLLDANYSEGKLSYTVTFENKLRERNSNYNQNLEIDEQIAEESRILYVALTRAIRNCIWIKNLDKNPGISWGALLEV